MLKRNQNLVFFVEEHEERFVDAAGMIKLYVNTFAIDEDAQFEIIGVFNLKKTNMSMYSNVFKKYNNYASERVEKEWFDASVIENAFERTFKDRNFPKENYLELHFVVSSVYYMNTRYHETWTCSPAKDSIQLKKIQKMIEINFHENSQLSNASKNYVLTLLTRHRGRLSSKFSEENIWLNQLTVPYFQKTMLDYFDDSVTQDVERFITDLKTGIRKNVHNILYFWPKITHKEQLLAQSRDPNYWNTFSDNYSALNLMRSKGLRTEYVFMHLLGLITNEEYLDCEKPQRKIDLINSRDSPEMLLKYSKSSERYLMASSNRVTTYFNL